MTEVVRLPVQDGATLTVLFVRAPAEAFDADGVLVVGSLSVQTRNRPIDGRYRTALPVFAHLPTVQAWLGKKGWEWREATPELNSSNAWQCPNPFEGE